MRNVEIFAIVFEPMMSFIFLIYYFTANIVLLNRYFKICHYNYTTLISQDTFSDILLEVLKNKNKDMCELKEDIRHIMVFLESM